MQLRHRTLPDHRAAYLYRHNSSLGRDHRTYCPTCDKTGKYLWGGVEYECDCAMQLLLHKLYLDAGIGVEYQRLSWSDWTGDPAVTTLCVNYIDNGLYKRGMGLRFKGGFGLGKTMALNLVLKDLVKRGLSCYSLTFASMINDYTKAWDDESDREYFTEKVLESQVLLMDDVGRSQRSSVAARNFHEAVFDDILRPRTQHGKPNLITTNLSDIEMSEVYGKGIASLLSAHVIDYDFGEGADYRPVAKDRFTTEALAGEVRPIV